MNETLNAIFQRRSIRSFRQTQIKDEELALIIDAGKAAPSSLNRQPWHFTVIQNKELLDRLVRDNKEVVLSSETLIQMAPWVKAPNYNNFYSAPTVILISGQKDNIWHVCDCALAMENMSLAAHSLGIGSVIVASTRFIFGSEKADCYMKELGIPAGFAPNFFLALGYSAGEKPGAAPRRNDVVTYIK